MPRAISIRRSLLQNLVTVILLLGGGLLLTTFFGTREAVVTLSESIINQSADEMELALQRFFDPVEQGVVIARSWGIDGLLDIEDTERLNRLFEPLLEQIPQIASILVADSSGAQYQILRRGDTYWNRLFREEWGERAQRVEHGDSDDDAELQSSWIEREYDPRDRPWFQGAIAKLRATDRSIHWTSPYVFITESEPGITASAAFAAQDGSAVVIGFDVRLEEITEFTSQEHATRNALVAILDDNGRLLGLPAIPQFSNPSSWRGALLKTPEELKIPLIDDANAAFQEQARVLPSSASAPPPVSFRSGGELWWAQARILPISSESNLLIAILVPDDDVFGERRALRVWILGLTGLVLVIAVIRAIRAAHRFSEPMEALAEESERISRGDLEAGKPIESELAEVRQLAQAHEHMRTGLASLMKMERDIQVARQIQQSTFPAKLPQLPGFDIAAWNDPADETGGDTYDLIPFKTANGDTVDRALLLLADATGHGIGPALVATQSRAMIRMAVRLDEGIAGIVKNMNEQLHADLPGNRFLTAWFGLLDAKAGTLTSFSAGQAPLLYYHASDHRVAKSSANTLPLGMMPDIPIEVPKATPMAKGDIFVVLSDGIFEAVGDDDEQFGEERVVTLLEEHHDADAAQVLMAIQQSVESFTKGRPADDDRTVWLIKKM